MQIDIKKVIESKSPGFFEKYPKIISSQILLILKKILHIDDVNDYLKGHSHLQGIDFIDGLFKYLDFSFNVDQNDLQKIPDDGKLIIISNHPLGGLDGLALLKAVSLVRSDVKVVVNDILQNIDNLKDLFLPYNLYSVKTQKKNIKKIEQSIENNEVIIFFPAAVVSRITMKGIKDRKWQKGALRLAKKFKSPILPVYVDARNSLMFYLLALLHDKAGTMLLPHELFNKRSSQIYLKIGNIIPYSSLKDYHLNEKKQTDLLQEHLYKLGKDSVEIFKTEKSIIEPVDKNIIKEELKSAQHIGQTLDDKQIFLVSHDEGKNIVREIGRLREITFRKVGEGTGKELDVEKYDTYYDHLVLWDKNDEEIVGSYRIGKTKDIIEKYGKKGLITSKKFDINDEFDEVLAQSLEVGRTFIQQKYWKSAALDYMWQGIGAFLKNNPDVRYLWGTVSMSDDLPDDAKDLIIYYYLKWYPGNPNLAYPHREYSLSDEKKAELSEFFNTGSAFKDFRKMKKSLLTIGHTVPVLYRRYTDITEDDGTEFINFCIDVTFKNSVDGFIVVDMTKLKKDVRERYYNQRSFVKKNGTSKN